MSAVSREPLRAALAPTSIALIGASDNPNKIGGRPLAYLSRFGFKGPVYPITPTRSVVQGVKTLPDIDDLPQTPEMAIVAVPGDAAVSAVERLARMGVKVCVIMSSGFGEVDERGKQLERQMTATARAHGMRLVGPNSQGLANFGTGAIASFSTMFIEAPPQDGPVGIISQSGAMSVIPYGLLRSRGIGVRHSHATGNDCDVTVCELAISVAQDPDLKLLLLYLEGIPDPWNLAEAAAVARERNLPVVVLKSGRSAAGQDAARSHTGSLASEDRVVDAFFADQGLWRVDSVAQMVETAELYLQGWKPKGRNLVAVSNSGAVCVLTADAASAHDMPMRPLSAQTQAELRTVLPSFATTTNPVDITAALLSNSSLLGGILPAIGRDPAADAFLVGIAVAGAGYDVDAFARDSAQFAAETGKPVVIATPQTSVADKFKALGMVVFPTESQAVAALSSYLSHNEAMQTMAQRIAAGWQPASPPVPAAVAAVAPATKGAPAAHSTPIAPTMPRLLDEAASLALLSSYGVPVVQHRLCADAASAVAAFEALGGTPVVIKGCTAQATHKSELGLVKLGVADATAVRAAYDDLVAAAARAGIALSGVVVAQQVRGRRELMLGARIDPVFGPVLLVGDGGKYVEVLPDTQLLLPPFVESSIEAALRKLRIAPLLDGVRDEPPLDVAAFCKAAACAGAALLDRGARIDNFDLNPVIVGAAGQGCVAVDAVVYQQGDPS